MKAIATATRNGKLDRVKSENLGIILERKIEDITSCLQPEYYRLLHTISEDNALTIANYILAMRDEINLSDTYRRNNIRVLCKFSKYHKNKPFTVINRDDILHF